MKVYVKKEEKKDTFMGSFIIILFLFITLYVIMEMINSQKTLFELFESYATKLIFLVPLFVFALYCLYKKIQRPKPYKVTLISKNLEFYNGKKIISMQFKGEVKTKKNFNLIPTVFKCYTKEENNLVVGNDYILYIKEYNFVPKSIKEYNSISENIKIKTNIPTTTLTPVFIMIYFILGSLFILSIIGMIIYPKEDRITYIIIGTLILTLLVGVYILNCKWNSDNTPKELNNEQEGNKQIDNNQEKHQ